MRQHPPVGRGHGHRAARLGAREGPADEQLVGLADGQPVAHAPAGSRREVLRQALPAALAPEPRLADAAERAGRVEAVEGVGPDDAGPQALGDPEDPRALLGPDAGRQAVAGGVGLGDAPRPRCGRSARPAPGPKTSSRAIALGAADAADDRRREEEAALGQRARPAGRCGSPRRRRSSTKPRIRSSWAAELMAPTSVFLSSGSPTRSSSTRRRSRSSSSSAMPSCASRREPAQQTWPWLKKIPSTIPSTAWSRAASSNTRWAPLPPSSRVRRRAGAGERAPDRLAHLGRAGERDLVEPRVGRERRAGGARAGDHVDHARREAGLVDQLGQQQRRERRGLGRLQHHRVAAARGPARSSRRPSAAGSSTG